MLLFVITCKLAHITRTLSVTKVGNAVGSTANLGQFDTVKTELEQTDHFKKAHTTAANSRLHTNTQTHKHTHLDEHF